MAKRQRNLWAAARTLDHIRARSVCNICHPDIYRGSDLSLRANAMIKSSGPRNLERHVADTRLYHQNPNINELSAYFQFPGGVKPYNFIAVATMENEKFTEN